MESITAGVACSAALALSYYIGYDRAPSIFISLLAGAASGVSFAVAALWGGDRCFRAPPRDDEDDVLERNTALPESRPATLSLPAAGRNRHD
jgi:hypothetical protein